MVLVKFSLALAPSLLLLWWAYRRDSVKKESIRLLLYAFLLGLLAVVPALLLGMAAEWLRGLYRGLSGNLYRAFISAALVEEGVKYLFLTAFVRRHEEFDEVADGLVYGMAGSLGFAFMENVLYVTGPTAVLLMRGITAVPLHAGCGALIGFFVGRAHFDAARRRWTGVLAAVATHGLYDLMVFEGGVVAYGALLIVVALCIIVPLLFRRAITLDIAEGRVQRGAGSI